MKNVNNIITLPRTVKTARAGETRPETNRPAAVINLTRHRAELEAQVKEASNRSLSPGEIWEALNEGRVQVHYQPQYDMATDKTIAAEALIRLVDIDGTLIYPDRFIELVEDSDLIVPLGRAVLGQACADLAATRASGIMLQSIAVNVSARQFNIDTGLVSFVDELVQRYGLQHDDLEFELTERQSLAPQCEGMSIINELAERGVRIVIDDFGIGYSSVVYLTELPVSAFKLDRALVTRLPEDDTMRSVVESLLALADNLGLDVVAEGIETQAQHECLTAAGCRYGQGFGFAKPMNIDALREFINNEKAASQQTS